jgi:hypothetical protein
MLSWGIRLTCQKGPNDQAFIADFWFGKLSKVFDLVYGDAEFLARFADGGVE